MASVAPWSPDEEATLVEHIDQDGWLGICQALLSNRTKAAIKVRMSKLRAEMGMGDGRSAGWDCLDEDAYQQKRLDDAVGGSYRLHQAIQNAGLRP